MKLAIFITIAAAAVIGNAIFWYRKGIRDGDRKSQEQITELVKKKTVYEVSLNEAAVFGEFMSIFGREPSYPLLILKPDRYTWNGRITE